jgi:uncharacterized protein YjbJ (UPF0337 family)
MGSINKDVLKGQWKEIKGKVKQEWGKLTDDDLTQIDGSYDELEGKLQKTYGFQKEKARAALEQFMKKNHIQ